MAKEKCDTEEKEVGKKHGWCHELLFLAGPGQSTGKAAAACWFGLCASDSNLDNACIYRVVIISASMIG
jgi:hypothetical protein